MSSGVKPFLPQISENQMSEIKAKARLFISSPLKEGASPSLSGPEAHYIVNVMRLKAGDKIALFNGCDGEWLATIVSTAKKDVALEVKCRTRGQVNEPDVWLVFAPIKRTRIDFMAQKATELGASRLVPVRTERTVVARVKTERLLANACEAAEQCERLTVPEVSEMTSLKNILAQWPADRLLLFCDEEKGDPPAPDALKSRDQKPARRPWGILIGPEGGFTSKERELIRSYSYCIPASLGPRVLRADTAALAALSLWQAAIGDW